MKTWVVSGRESSASAKDVDRAKLVRDRQNEERQRKLDEMRQQALAAQRFREQREEERRRRIDELRSRDNDRYLESQIEPIVTDTLQSKSKKTKSSNFIPFQIIILIKIDVLMER